MSIEKPGTQGTFPPEIAATYNNIMTYFDYDKNVEIFDGLVRKLLPGRECLSVLEIGVGTGHFASRLARRGYAVKGLDDSTKMLEELKRNYGGIPVVLQSVANLNLQAESYDVVVSAAGPMRFNYYEDERIFESYLSEWRTTEDALRRVWTHLRKGGLLVMSQNSDPEHPGFFKSTGDVMAVPGGMTYTKRERRDSQHVYKSRRLTQGDRELWHIEHVFSWKTPEDAQRTLQQIGFEVIGFDLTNTYHISKKGY